MRGQFRTVEEKRLIVEATRKTGVSVATVARAHGVNANQVFYWRKLYEAGQLESVAGETLCDLESGGVRLLPISVDEGEEPRAPLSNVIVATTARAPDAVIELTLARGQLRIAGPVDAGTLRTVLRCLLA